MSSLKAGRRFGGPEFTAAVLDVLRSADFQGLVLDSQHRVYWHPRVVTSLPTNPIDGDEVIFLADANNGILWHLKYRASANSTYRWEFVGGSPMRKSYEGALITASTNYTTLPNGPSLTVALPGEYRITITAKPYTTGAYENVIMSYAIGGGAASDATGLYAYSGPGGTWGCAHGSFMRTTIGEVKSPNTTITTQYRVDSGVVAYYNTPTIECVPVRVG
jgi:hypothetical protein